MKDLFSMDKLKSEGAAMLSIITPLMVGVCLFIIQDMHDKLETIQIGVNANTVDIAVIESEMK